MYVVAKFFSHFANQKRVSSTFFHLLSLRNNRLLHSIQYSIGMVENFTKRTQFYVYFGLCAGKMEYKSRAPQKKFLYALLDML